MKKYFIEVTRSNSCCYYSDVELMDGNKDAAIAEAEDMFDRLTTFDKKNYTGKHGSMIVHEVELSEEQWEEIKEGSLFEFDANPVWDADTYWALRKADDELRDIGNYLDVARNNYGDDKEAYEDELKAYEEAEQAYEKAREAYMLMVG